MLPENEPNKSFHPLRDGALLCVAALIEWTSFGNKMMKLLGGLPRLIE